jgi:pyruvate/2-oxoglutarate dehydrogenase complex dihydrolipoamide dehydrogenase (E3) component
MAAYDFDLVVIGAGGGGITAATTANGMGKRVAMIEKRRIGGDCTQFGCVPSKALIKSAAVAHDVGTLERYGLKIPATAALDTDGVMARVRAVIESVYEGETPERFEGEGITVLFGAPKFIDSHRITLDGKTISARSFVIATGSHPFIPPLEGLADTPYHTNETIFSIDAIPKSMIVLGGGPIGTELSQAFARLGCAVTVIEKGDTVLSREDPILARELQDRIVAEGVTVINGARAERTARTDSGVTVTLSTADGSRDITAEILLVAVGRRPNIEGLDLEKAGVETTPHGITTNLRLRTTALNIYACGDVAGPYLFSHMAEYQGMTAALNAVLPIKRKVSYDHVPWCTFTDPELAHAGLTEAEARERYGDSIRVFRHEFKHIDRARTDDATTGRSLFICDRRGRLLGAHILGHGAGDLIHEAQLVKTLGLPFKKIQSAIHIYPTYADIVRVPARNALVDGIRNHPLVKLARAITGK